MNKPEMWAKSNSITLQFGNDLSDEFHDELGKMSGRCIDIGSGPCNVTVDIFLPKLDSNATLVCSDISDAMLEFGEKKYKDKKRVSFLKLDIETPNLPEDLIEQFDHATSFHCIHWCQDMRQVFGNFFSLLRPGGTLLLEFITHFPGMDSYKKLAAMPRYQPYMKDVDRWLPVFQNTEQPQRTLKKLIKDVGFEIHHCSVRERSYTYDDLDAFSTIIVAGSSFIDRMPADLKKEFERDLPEEFAKHSIILNKNSNNERDYSVLLLMRAIVVYLQKPLAE